jgi:hypothetical protein
MARLLKKKKLIDPYEKGRFQWDEETESWIKVADTHQSEGKIPMPLQDYINRSRHLSKGSWKRPTDERHLREDAIKDDFGTAGCKNGRGAFHPMVNGRCIHCGLDKRGIEKRQKEG